MLITSNRSVVEWGSVFGDPVVATAILDRLLHHSHVITIRGDSYRREKRRSGSAPSLWARLCRDRLDVIAGEHRGLAASTVAWIFAVVRLGEAGSRSLRQILLPARQGAA